MAEGDQEPKDQRITGGRTAEREGARLLVLAGTGVGRKLPLRDGLVLGRSADCELVVDDAELSRRHARFLAVVGSFVVEDLGSRNGTWVNGSRIDAPTKLAFGDRVQVGRTILQLAPYDRVEEQLLHRQRLETLGRLSAGIAHDFNNMVGAVSASVAYLRRLPPDARAGSDAEECLDDIEAAARRAAELASRLLAFARAEAEGSGPSMVSEVCHEVVQLARRTFERAIRIESVVEPGLYVHLSSAQLHQVLMNLCLNARDAIVDQKPSGRIVVRALAGTGGRDVVLTVEDDGCGMDEETRSRIFEPFFTTKGDGAGFGLGLSTVSDIVRAHGGSIVVESTPGSGSTFTLRMAAATPARRGASVTTAVGSKPITGRGDGRTVLLVDDEVVMRRSLGRVLGRAGFEVVAVGDGESALSLLDEPNRNVDVVLLDLDLPGLSGEETLRLVRRRSRRLPVVCITGHADRIREAAVRARGAQGYLVKPCEPEELVETLLEAIRGDGGQGSEDTTEV
jgi:two-component system, cell cycle sensor histidine kinase and response regulator CckA